jgi:hypothetical protein
MRWIFLGIWTPHQKTIASIPSLNVQLPLVKLFLLRSIDRLFLRPDSFFPVPQRTIGTRQAVPFPTQHRPTISFAQQTYHSFFPVPQRTIATRQAVPLPTQHRPYLFAQKTIGSFSSLNVQLPLVKLFLFLRSIDRPSLRPANVP